MQSNERPELLMPVSEESAALQFFIEALKQNTAILERVGKSMEGLQAEQKETLRMVQDTRERVIKLESGGQSEAVAEIKSEIVRLKDDIHILKSAEARRAGAVGAMEWASRFGPWLLALALGALALAGLDRVA